MVSIGRFNNNIKFEQVNANKATGKTTDDKGNETTLRLTGKTTTTSIPKGTSLSSAWPGSNINWSDFFHPNREQPWTPRKSTQEEDMETLLELQCYRAVAEYEARHEGAH